MKFVKKLISLLFVFLLLSLGSLYLPKFAHANKDLGVSAFTFPDGVAGTTTNPKVRIKNSGNTAITGSFNVRVQNKQPDGTGTAKVFTVTANISPNQIIDLSEDFTNMPLPSPAGSYTAAATVDSNNDINDSDRTNNKKTDTYTTTAAGTKDLTVSTFTYLGGDAGGTTNPTVIIKNIGTAAITGSFNVRVQNKQPDGSGTAKVFTVTNTIPANGELDLSDKFTNMPLPSPAGSYTAVATVDSNTDIAESNEGNNKTPPYNYSTRAVVCDEKNPTIEMTSGAAQSAVQGDTAAYNFTVTNNDNSGNCPGTRDFTISVNSLPAGVPFDPKSINVSQQSPVSVTLNIHTLATTPTSPANNPYSLIIDVKSATNPAKDATSPITLEVTQDISTTDCTLHPEICTSGQICNTDTHACETPSTDCVTNPNLCTNGQYCASDNTCHSGCGTDSDCASGQTCDNNHTCQATNTNDCTLHPELCTGNQTCNQDTGICENPATDCVIHPNLCQTGTVCNTTTHQCEPVIPSGAAALSFIVGLDDIGTTGDNVSSVYNTPVKSPAHLQRPIKVELFEGTNITAKYPASTGTLTYVPVQSCRTLTPPCLIATRADEGKFVGGISLPDNFTPGNYIVKITVPGHLTRQIPGVQNIVTGSNHMAAVNLVTGDINGNNQLDIDIHDYSILIGCSNMNHTADDTAQCNANSNYKLLSDLNDDGTDTTPNVDHIDYSLFIRELGIQNGD